MKKIALILAMVCLVGCGVELSEREIEERNARSRAAVEEDIKRGETVRSTGAAVAKIVGGKALVTLPRGNKLVLVTWKHDNLWTLYRPFREGEFPEEYVYKESSLFGVMEATIVIRELPKG